VKLGDRVMVLPTREEYKRVRPVNDPRAPIVRLPARATLISTEVPFNQEATLNAIDEVGNVLRDEVEVEFENGGQRFVHRDEIRPLDVCERLAELA